VNVGWLITLLAFNHPPLIVGAPTESVLAGDTFSFQPSIVDPDGDQLTYEVFNLPLWASFDPATGAVAGAPEAGDIGLYENIEITVSDGNVVTALTFDVEVVAMGFGSISLNWVPATANEDGSELLGISGHKIYWGTTADAYRNVVTIDSPAVAAYVIEGLLPGRYRVAMSTLDGLGVESDLSAPIEVVVD
jgi:Putative Ig domain